MSENGGKLAFCNFILGLKFFVLSLLIHKTRSRPCRKPKLSFIAVCGKFFLIFFLFSLSHSLALCNTFFFLFSGDIFLLFSKWSTYFHENFPLILLYLALPLANHVQEFSFTTISSLGSTSGSNKSSEFHLFSPSLSIVRCKIPLLGENSNHFSSLTLSLPHTPHCLLFHTITENHACETTGCHERTEPAVREWFVNFP